MFSITTSWRHLYGNMEHVLVTGSEALCCQSQDWRPLMRKRILGRGRQADENHHPDTYEEEYDGSGQMVAINLSWKSQMEERQVCHGRCHCRLHEIITVPISRTIVIYITVLPDGCYHCFVNILLHVLFVYLQFVNIAFLWNCIVWNMHPMWHWNMGCSEPIPYRNDAEDWWHGDYETDWGMGRGRQGVLVCFREARNIYFLPVNLIYLLYLSGWFEISVSAGQAIWPSQAE